MSALFLVLLLDKDDNAPTSISMSSACPTHGSRASLLLAAVALLVLGLLASTALQLMRRRQPLDAHDALPVTTVPVFLAAGATQAGQRAAHSTLRAACEHYRLELSVRMKALDDMVHVHLPGWKDSGDAEGEGSCDDDLTARLQARMWKAFEGLPACWQTNDDVLARLLRFPEATTALPPTNEIHQEAGNESTSPSSSSSSSSTPSFSSYNDAVQVLTHLYRDWTVEGQEVRRKTYGPILQAVARLLPRAGGGKILVPGAGLGRLAFELAVGGQHHVTALDISPVMVTASASVLGLVLSSSSSFFSTGEEAAAVFSFYPFLHDPLLNQRSHARRFHAVTFPDVGALQQVQQATRRRGERRRKEPSSSSSSSFPSLALELGDFVQLAAQPTWAASQDAVVTCFFIDTGHNVLSYLASIHRLLKEGGVWINLGPLNYHQTLKQGAVQLTLEELEAAAQGMGLEKVEGWVEESCAYRPEPTAPESAFLRTDVYQPVFGVYRKTKTSSKA